MDRARSRLTSKVVRVFVCSGKHCSKCSAKTRKMLDAMKGVSMVEVGCQKICDGPVLGLAIDDRLQWFARVDSEKSRRALVTLITDGELKKPLKKRRVPKRSGKRRD